MKTWKSLRVVLTASFLAAGVLGVAYAQDDTPGKGQRSPQVAMGAAGQEPQLSPEQQGQKAEAMIAGMDRARKMVQSQLSDARRSGDVIKALCLDDKLTQMDTAIKSAEERNKSLQQAIKSGDASLASHEFMVLNVLNDRMKQLKVEANQCIGNDIGVPGETSVKVSVDPNLPHEDPADYPETPGVTLTPPVCVSCVR